MKKILVIVVILLSMTTLNSCSDSQASVDSDEESNMPIEVSIIRLIANPIDYHGRRVRVDGVANLSIGATAVYLCTDSWFYLSTRNALWVDIEQDLLIHEGNLYEHWYYINGEWVLYEDAQHLNGKRVTVEGTFDMYKLGNRGMYSGGIVDVTRFRDSSMFYRGMFDDPDNPYYMGNPDGINPNLAPPIGNTNDWFYGLGD